MRAFQPRLRGPESCPNLSFLRRSTVPIFVRPLLFTRAIPVLLLSLATATMATAQPPSRPPGLMYSTLLNGVQLNDRTGELRLDQIQAVFLPEPPSDNAWSYNPDDGKLTARLSGPDNQQLAEYRFYAQKLQGVFWNLSGYQITTPDGANQDVQLTQPGNYELVFSVEGKPFYRFPFKVAVQQSGDEFDPQPRYHLEGAWSHMGYLFYAEANPSNAVAFKTWLRDKDKGDAYRSDKVNVRVIRESDGELVAVSGSDSHGTTYQLKPNWVRFSFELYAQPRETATLKTNKLLSANGSYRIEVEVNGEKWGAFPFQVADGKIVKAGRQVRDSTDPLEYVEGGRDAWWLDSQTDASASAR